MIDYWFIIGIFFDVIGTIIVFGTVAFLIGKVAWEWSDSDTFIYIRNNKKRKLDEYLEKVVKILLLVWVKIPFIKIIYIIIAGLIGVNLLILFFNLFDDVAGIPTNDNIDPSDVRNLAIAFLGTVTGIGALFGVYLAILKSETNERQTYTEEQGLITDRINKAIERLSTNDAKGKPIIEVRLGALYALERIAQDSIRDHIQIMDILCAYIKTNSPLPKKATPLSKDIQVALNIIGWRGNGIEGRKRLRKERQEKHHIDLSYCDLHGLIFYKINLSRAILYHSNLDKARFYEAAMKSTRFDYAKLSDVRIKKTDMTNGDFSHAEITDSLISESNLTKASFFQADLSKSHIGNRTLLYKASFYYTNMSNMGLDNIDMANVRFENANLKDAEIHATNLSNTNFYGIDMKNVNLRDSYAYNGDFLNHTSFTKKQLDTMFCGIDVEIPNHLTMRPKHWPTEKLHKDFFMKAYWNWRREIPTNYDPEYSAKYAISVPSHLYH